MIWLRGREGEVTGLPFGFLKRAIFVRNMTHQFAHIETLERARRWLIQAGIDPSRIEARTQGILSLAVAVEHGESAEVQRIIDAAESSDPDGNPGIWDVASQRHVYPQVDTATAVAGNAAVFLGQRVRPERFEVFIKAVKQAARELDKDVAGLRVADHVRPTEAVAHDVGEEDVAIKFVQQPLA